MRPDELTARRAEIDLRIGRLLTRLALVESAAHQARSGPELYFGWPPFSLDTGLTPDQESFVVQWSPDEVLAQCSAQHEMAMLLRDWVHHRTDPADLDLALALVSTFSDRLGGSFPTETDRATAADQAPQAWQQDERGASVALLDREGVIVAVNQVWTDFCLANGGRLDTCGPGASYLEACAADDDEDSATVARAIHDAVRGEALHVSTLTIPCHSPTQQRWYDVVISSRLSADARTLCGATVILTPATTPSRLAVGTSPTGSTDLAAELHREVTSEVYSSTMTICSVLDRVTDPVALEHIHRGVLTLDRALARLRRVAVLLEPGAADASCTSRSR